uniref:E3 ubiquitin-protein ligase CHFR n=1 Tax=Spodoptera frugiperda TaxID=7108 RepID=A0A2H1WFN0_SPOFR
MENSGTWPYLRCCKNLKSEFSYLSKIPITADGFTLGRNVANTVIVPFLSISRNHCKFIKGDNNKWILQDLSTFGVSINGVTVGKGCQKTLAHNDVICLEPTNEFVYYFVYPPQDNENYETPSKRIKMEDAHNNKIIDDVKMKFEESQTFELKHIEEKIQNAKQMQNTTIILKEQLQTDMNRKIHQLQSEFALQIQNLKGENDKVEEQKIKLIEERDMQLATIKQATEQKICELMEQIQKHNETESELLRENNLLKEKLTKERKEFLSELNRENTSKQEMLEKLKAKLREQEDLQLRERQNFVNMLQKETEQLRLAKEKEMKELEEQRKQRENDLKEELNNIKKNLEDKIQQTEQEKLKAEQLLNEQMENMKKLNDVEQIKMKELMKEREELQKKYNEAQSSAEKSLEELKMRVTERENELAAIAADRIQKQVEMSSAVINTLQEQLEKVKNQLQTVESERNTILETIAGPCKAIVQSSKDTVLTEMGELMESELQCSICNELFVQATTLNCSHTFCKYCISVWKKKKRDCPVCRASITSECRSLVLDSFIDKMVQSLSEEMKQKRKDILKDRKELESEQARQSNANTTRGNSSSYSSADDEEYDSEFAESEEGPEEDYLNYDYDGEYGNEWNTESDDSRLDSDDADGGRVRGNRSNRRIAETVEGLPNAYYGGYGRCYKCGARGHWAPGCPFR